MTVKFLGHWDRAVDCTCDAANCSHQRSSRKCMGDATLEVRSTGDSRRSTHGHSLSQGDHILCQKCFANAEIRDIHARDPGQPGRKNPSRRRQEAKERGPGGLKSAMVRRVRKGATPKRPLIGRRKTVRTSAKGLISRKSAKAAKRAMFRMGQQGKLLACHACARKDFATEKSLKRHTEKFHTPGAKSPRGFRTARNAEKDRMFGPKCHKCGRPEYVYSVHPDGRPKHTQCAHCARLADMGQAAKRTFRRKR